MFTANGSKKHTFLMEFIYWGLVIKIWLEKAINLMVGDFRIIKIFTNSQSMVQQ